VDKSFIENSVCSCAGSGLEPAAEARDPGYPQCWGSAVREMRPRLNWA